MKYSVVVPVYNGEKTVIPLFLQIKEFFEGNGLNYQVIFVHDCGRDNSVEVLLKLKSEYSKDIVVITLSRNFGQHNAIICGFEYADGDFIITLDEDLQHSPKDIQILINCQAANDFDVVYGCHEVLKHSLYRNLTSKVIRNIIRIGIPEIYPNYSAYRLIKKDIAKATTRMQNSYTFLDGYLSWVTSRIGSCNVSHSERHGGKTSYTFTKLLNHTINIFVTFSNLPLRILTKTSLWVMLIMTVYSTYILYRKIVYDDLALGYSSLIITIGFGVGLIMFSLGIIGEYIYRINLKTTKRPNYSVNKVF